MQGIIGNCKLTPEQELFYHNVFGEELNAHLQRRFGVAKKEDLTQQERNIMLIILSSMPDIIMTIRRLLPEVSAEPIASASEDTELAEIRRMVGL